LAAIPELNPCINGFPSQCIFNYDYQIINLSVSEFEFLLHCDGKATVREILQGVELGIEGVRSLLQQQVIILTPA